MNRRFVSLLPAAFLACAPAVVSAADADGIETAAAEPTKLSPVTVEGKKEAGPTYNIDTASSGTKTGTPLLETPQSIQVITRELIEDQDARILDDVLRNVAGVMPGGYYGDYDYFRIRGFDASGYAFLDGLPMSKGTVTNNKEIFGLESVEIVRGPAAVLYGAGSLGGLVNLVSKRPREENFADLEISTGRYLDVEPAIDAGAVLAKGLSARVNALYRDEGSFTDFGERQRFYIAPSLTWQIADSTELTVLTSYTDNEDKLGFPLPAEGTVLPNPNGKIPLSRYIGDPDQPIRIQDEISNLGYQFTHRFSDNWSLRQNARYTKAEQVWDNVTYPGALLDDKRTLTRYPLFLDGNTDNWDIDTSVIGEFDTGTIQHRLLIGVERYEENSFNAYAYGEDPDGTGFPIDLFEPDYSTTLPERPASLGPGYRTKTAQTGIYVQDQLSLADWTLTIGARYDESEVDSGSANRDYDVTPRAGLTWQFVPGVAVYANYSESFLPQSGQLLGGGNAKPETGDNREVGIKGDLLDGRLLFSAAIYELLRENLTTAVPNQPEVVVQTAKARSRGFEIDGSYEILPGWTTQLAYTYIDAETTEEQTLYGVTTPKGTRLINVPKNIASLWSRYNIQTGAFAGLGAGLGVRHYSDQSGDTNDTFSLPEYTLVNAALYWTRGPIRLQANLNNLFDEEYYVGSYDRLYVLPSTPSEWTASLRYSF